MHKYHEGREKEAHFAPMSMFLLNRWHFSAKPRFLPANRLLYGTQLRSFQKLQPQTVHHVQCGVYGGGIQQLAGGVGVTAQDHLVAHLGGNFPEPPGGVVPLGAQTQQIDLQRDITFFRSFAQALHMLPVGNGISGKPQQIGVGKIGEQARLHGFDALVAVLDQVRPAVGGAAVIGAAFLVADPVLPQDHIVDVLASQQLQKLLKMRGIVFSLHTQGYVQSAGIGLLQAADGGDIFRKLVGVHPHCGIVAAGEGIGGVVGEAQGLKTGLQGAEDIGFIRAFGVAAAGGVGVKIVEHGRYLLFAPWQRGENLV